MTKLRLRPYRLLKGYSHLRAQAIPLAEATHHEVPKGSEQFAISCLMKHNDAQLCLVEVLNAKGERPHGYVPKGTRSERLAAAGIEPAEK